MRPDRVNPETPVEIIAMIKVSGSPWLQEQLRSRCRELINIFSTSVRSLPAQVDPMVIEIDRTKWEAPRNRLPPRHHSAEKQAAIRTQVNKLLELGVIKELQASTYGRWSMAIDPRLVQLNAVTQVPDGWLIPNMLETITSTHRLQGSWWSIPVDTGCYVTERSWPLLSTQYAEQGPQWTCLRNMRNIHRRCTHTRQIRSGAPP